MKCIVIITAVFLLSAGTSSHAEKKESDPQQINIQKKEKLLQVIASSESEYTRGIDAYDRGDKKKADLHFRKAVRLLSSRRMDHTLLYGLSDYFERIYRELNNRINLIETSNESPHTLPPIPIDEQHPMVQKYIRLFSSDPTRQSIIRAFERLGMYKDMVSRVLQEYGLPPELVYLPIIESRYYISNRSRAGADGLWQFMKHTSRGYDLRVDFWVDERRDPEKSTRAAARYLKNLYYWFNDWHLALAAYNRGENGIGRDLAFSKTTDFSNLADRDAIPSETEQYIPQFMACVIISRDPITYGIAFEYEVPVPFEIYETDAMIDLEIAAKCADTTVRVIKELNPSLCAWCTPNNYPRFPLKIPYGTLETFKQKIQEIDNLCPAREFVRYKVQKGDVLGRIALRYNTTVHAIVNDNNIKNTRLLMPGKVLIIKPGKKYYR